MELIMNKFIKRFDGFMSYAYSATISVMDVAVITIISALSQLHWSVWLLLAPWIWYSTHQKFKYEK